MSFEKCNQMSEIFFNYLKTIDKIGQYLEKIYIKLKVRFFFCNYTNKFLFKCHCTLAKRYWRMFEC